MIIFHDFIFINFIKLKLIIFINFVKLKLIYISIYVFFINFYFIIIKILTITQSLFILIQ
jgi:hypothetical protein